MSMSFSDPNTLELLHSTKILLYLKNAGWKESQSKKKQSTWVKSEGLEKFFLEIPKEGHDFFIELLQSALNTLEKVEKRPKAEIIVDIQNSLSDQIEIIFNHNVLDGSLSINTTIDFLENIRKIFYWSAYLTFTEKKQDETSRLQSTQDYVNQLRISQKIHNQECIFTIISPLVLEVDIDKTLQLSESFKREVVVKFTNVLMEIQELKADGTTSLKIFSPITSKVKVNELEIDAVVVLETLSKLNGENGLKILIKWSPLLPKKADIPERIEISSDAIRSLEKVTGSQLVDQQ